MLARLEVSAFCSFFLVACGPAELGSKGRERTAEVNPSAISIVSKADFETRGLTWPLTVVSGNLGCTNQARWIEVGDVRYGVNGTASTARGYQEIEPIWAVDEKMAKLLEDAGAPNDPPLRVNIGDLIKEAGKLC